MAYTCKNEKDVKKHVKKILDQHGWFWWMPSANAFGKAGTSDILALRAGVFLAIETKFDKNKPTAMQKQFLDSVTAEGGFGFCVNETMLEDFAKWNRCFDSAIAAQQRGEKPSPEDGAELLNCIKIMTELLHAGNKNSPS